MRQIVLDTETTGLDHAQGDRVIEIGCVEILNRRLTGRRFHRYLNPDRDSSEEALQVHGLTREFLSQHPRFGEIAAEFLDFVQDSELVIHNASFDIGFLNSELQRHQGDAYQALDSRCPVLDSLILARQIFPRQRNSLDALCKRLEIDNSGRDLHGALLDAELLADVYLRMTGGQVGLFAAPQSEEAWGDDAATGSAASIQRLASDRPPLKILLATADEQAEHGRFLDFLEKKSGRRPLWPQ